MVPPALELQVDTAVFEALGVHPVAQADRAEQFHRARLEQAGPLPRLAVGPAAVSTTMESMPRRASRWESTGRPAGPDDSDLSA